MSNGLVRFLGDSPVRVVFKLIVVSFLVGLVLAGLDWTPWDVIFAARDFFHAIWEMGFQAIDRFFGYFLLGAVIVVPAFFVLRLLNYRRG
ncbi:hypothetical protein CSC94_19130 [Zhengella mangrovi]|uniref:DUF6460 domain-containing protein n=1 Tax=Zhengella mangrovi TaxID=1982044 RepID=A0A2G1QJ01_9HYPH|nr:DUF6460 domain-containing protein [Zhengella mangrovi]PHP65469.1 hypothetical protein CSC94_19130 [Zhengella mangrovi]